MDSYKTLSDKLFKVLVNYKLHKATLSDCVDEFQKIIEEIYPEQWVELLNGFSIREHIQHYEDPAITALIIQQLCKNKEEN